MFSELPLLVPGVPQLLGQPPVLLRQVVHSLNNNNFYKFEVGQKYI